jgi:hypothetical protein
MRRLAAILAFALVLAVPVWAQHGGGHGGGGFGGGHAGGFSGHTGGAVSHAGGFSGSHASGFSGHAGRPFSPRASGHNFSSRPFLHDGGVGVRIRSFGSRNSCYGYLCRGYGYGYYPWGWGYYDPSWWWDNSNDDDSSQNVAAAAEMNRDNLEQQRMLRQEQADGDQDSYSSRADDPRHSDDNGAETQEKTGSPMFANTVLVFRDKHQQEVENYAIVGDTLWNFAPQHTQKISLDDLDLAATQKANEDRGMTFRLPSGS